MKKLKAIQKNHWKGWFHILIHLLHEVSVEICVKEILVTQEIPRKDESDMHLDMNEV